VTTISSKTKTRFKTYKSDAAPFFFYIDIFPPDPSVYEETHISGLVKSLKDNPIMPLPMRVDRVFNGQSSVLIRPREPISFPINEDIVAFVNPSPFLQFGFEKLLYFTEVRSNELLFMPLNYNKMERWWLRTQFLYGNLYRIEEDFSAFLRAYLHTMIKAKIAKEDLSSAATEYCQMIADICKDRMEKNSILVDSRGEQKKVKLYKIKQQTYIKKFKRIKKKEFHPELIDIDVFNLSERGFSKDKDERSDIIKEMKPNTIKYLPLLFYDDLLECMLQNLKKLEESVDEILDPSLLLDQNVIILKKSDDTKNIKSQEFSWWNKFEKIHLESIFKSIRTTYQKELERIQA
jgi:hypothetical protein